MVRFRVRVGFRVRDRVRIRVRVRARVCIVWYMDAHCTDGSILTIAQK